VARRGLAIGAVLAWVVERKKPMSAAKRKKSYSHAIWRDGNIVGYTPAGSPWECLLAILRDSAGLSRRRAVAFVRRAMATKPGRRRGEPDEL
jgi:hypothetical protein